MANTQNPTLAQRCAAFLKAKGAARAKVAEATKLQGSKKKTGARKWARIAKAMEAGDTATIKLVDQGGWKAVMEADNAARKAKAPKTARKPKTTRKPKAAPAKKAPATTAEDDQMAHMQEQLDRFEATMALLIKKLG